MGIHTVEKIGGTSMTRFGELLDNILIADRKGNELYNRIFIVSAYGGITNLLLEDKKTGEPGVYGKFADGSNEWLSKLEETRARMIELNRSFESIGLDQDVADAFVNERIDGVRDCLLNLMQLRSFGHFKPSDYLPASREFLSAIGEAHSAFNSVEILKKKGVNAKFVDLSGWKDNESHSIEQMVEKHLANLDFSTCMPIVTGYVKCAEGIMNRYDRGYSEITFCKVASVTAAKEGIIHKEFHLSTGDPKLMGIDNVKIIGNTNFDIADQLADMAMEAIHPKASKEMEINNIPIRVKNAFDPANPGTLISVDYISPNPKVDMICGRKDIVAIEVFDPEMVGASGYDFRLLAAFNANKISYIAKNTNANTITHYVSEKSRNLAKCIETLEKEFPGANIKIYKVAIVAVIGSNMKFPGFLSRAAAALAAEDVNIYALDQCIRQVNMQFIINRDDFEKAQIALHRALVEKEF